MSGTDIQIGNFVHADFESYADFAITSFGKGSYQSTKRYLRWLYECNPLSRGHDCDMWVARTNENVVVGCIHVMRLKWTQAGREQVIPTLHNTMMHPDHRGVAGGMLILQAFRGESHAFVPGAEGAVADALRRMKFSVVPSSWSRRILRPLAAGTVFTIQRLGWHGAYIELAPEPNAWRPSVPADIAGCVAFANRGDPAVLRPCWTPQTFFWRFFHPEGPRHLMLIEGDAAAPEGYVIISLGLRWGVRLARIVDLQASTPKIRSMLIGRAEDAARRQRIHLMFDYTAGVETPLEAGWNRYPSRAQTLFFHRTAQDMPVGYAIPAAAGDYGFEALLTRP